MMTDNEVDCFRQTLWKLLEDKGLSQMAEGRRRKKELVCNQILCEAKLHPEFTGKEIAGVIGAPPRTVYRYIAEMRKDGRMPQAA